MQVKGQNKFTLLQKVYMAYVLGKISFEDFTEARRMILEEQSG